jgi:diadenosine tetraphosphate (Ap4A) HIT family hydrolase
MTDEAESCVFCKIVRRELTPEVLAFRGEHAAVFPSLRQQPRNRGHMLVVPVRHVAQLYDVSSDLAGPLMTTLARVTTAVKSGFGAQGVSVRQNNEYHGGQDVFHVHFHVIPRFAGDEFDTGDARFPFGAIEIPLTERVQQAATLTAALGANRL